MRKKVLYMVLVAVTYQIWRARNGAYWNMKVNRIDCIVKEIKCIVKHRGNFCKSAIWSSRYSDWFMNL